MKILQIGKYYHPYLGGMETVLRNLAEGLLDAAVGVDVLTSGQGEGDRTEDLHGPRTGRKGRLIRASRFGVLNSQPLNFTLPGLLRRELESSRPDLVHLHLPNPLASMAWLALRASRTVAMPPLALWYHADITKQRFGRLLVQPAVNACFGIARGVCVSSATLAQSSPVLSRSGRSVTVIPFGIEPEPWSDIVPTWDGPFVFVGRLVPYKGLEDLLEAIAKISQARLVIVGDGPLRSPLEARARELGLWSRVEFAGALSNNRVAGLLARSRALVLPSRDVSETFGLVQLEAMAAGVPVVASDLPTGIREVGVPGETCLLVPPGDSAALAMVLRRLVLEPDLAARLGRAGRDRYFQHFTRDHMVANILAWYQKLLVTDLKESS